MASLGCILGGCKILSDKISQRPNVLFISVDDLNNWIEPLGGHPQAKTPNLLKFAKQGNIPTSRVYIRIPRYGDMFYRMK
jgi:hypothetical protein